MATITLNAIDKIYENGFQAVTNLSLDISAVTTANWDPTQIVQLGIQFYTGDPPEAGTYAGPNDVVFHIDEVTDGTGDVVRARYLPPPPA